MSWTFGQWASINENTLTRTRLAWPKMTKQNVIGHTVGPKENSY